MKQKKSKKSPSRPGSRESGEISGDSDRNKKKERGSQSREREREREKARETEKAEKDETKTGKADGKNYYFWKKFLKELMKERF